VDLLDARNGASNSAAQPPELPKNVNQQLSGVTFTRFDKWRRLFVIHAARTLAYKQGGMTELKDVYVEYFGHSGKPLRHPENSSGRIQS